jgi:hypothetical protein
MYGADVPPKAVRLVQACGIAPSAVSGIADATGFVPGDRRLHMRLQPRRPRQLAPSPPGIIIGSSLEDTVRASATPPDTTSLAIIGYHPAKTELNGCFSGRSGRARTGLDVHIVPGTFIAGFVFDLEVVDSGGLALSLVI